MPDQHTSTGRSYTLPSNIQPRDDLTGLDALFSTTKNTTAGILKEQQIAKGVLYLAKHIFNENPTYEMDDSYNIFNDPQISRAGLDMYVGNFMHSRSADHTASLIKRFKEHHKKYAGSPAYIAGRIIGGILDPSSLFLFTKAGSWVLTGSRLKRGAMVGGIVGAEEASKRYFDDSRPMIESTLITAGGFIIPALFPSLPAKAAGKKFDRSAQLLDDADDSVFQSAGTMGAAAPKGEKWITLENKIKETEILIKEGKGTPKVIKTWKKQLKLLKEELKIEKKKAKRMFMGDKEFQAENQIKPTGLGIFGEQGPWNPIFYVMKNGIVTAQEFMERTLEGSLYQIKNFSNIATSPSIERAIKSRYTPLVITTIREMETLYSKYLARMGKSGQNFIERTFDTKFYRSTNEGKKVLTPRQFREQIWMARMGSESVEEEAKVAAKSLDKYYGKIGKEYDELNIAQAFIEKQIATLEKYIQMTTNNAKKAKFISIKRKLQSRLDYINKYGSLKKDNYINMIFKRDVIEHRFHDFHNLMRGMLKKRGLSKDQIDEIIEQFKHYQPVIRFPNIADEVKAARSKNMVIDIDEYVDKINKISARFRARDLGLDNDDYIRLAEAGFIEKDTQTLIKLYFNQTIPDIEITKVFGDPMGYGIKWTNSSGFQLGIKQISDDYDELINAAKGAKQNELIKLKEEVLMRLDASIHLLRGTQGLHEDPNRALSRFYRIGKLYNSLTMLTGIAQVVDTARLITINGITKTFRLNWEVLTSGYAKEVWKKSMNTTQLGGEATDMFNSSRVMSMYGMDDAFTVFNKFERGMSSLGNLYFTFLNLSNPWNTAVKTIAGFYNGTRMLENIELLVKGKKLTKVNAARLKNLGIDDDMAKRIWKEYIKWGTGKGSKNSWKKNGDGYKLMRVANSEMWKDQKAADAFHNAIGKQANIDIVTPSKGDIPLWANTEIGGILTQFKKFGMASSQRMLMRGMQEGDAQFLQGVLLLMAAGAMVDAFRQRAYNRKYANKPFGQKLVDAFDRSGLGGIYSDINNSIERLANNEIGLRPILGAKKPYGTYRDFFNNPIPDVLGPSASQIANISDIMWTWGSGKYNHHTARNVRRLVPFQNVWFLDSLFDEVERDVLR